MSITKNQIRRMFESQGADHVKLVIADDSLVKSRLLPREESAALTIDQTINFVIGAASPAPERAAVFVRERASLTSLEDAGLTLRGYLTDCITNVQPFAKINFFSDLEHVSVEAFDDDVIEFGEDFQNGGFSRRVVIAGGLIGAITARIHNEIQSGWVEPA